MLVDRPERAKALFDYPIVMATVILTGVATLLGLLLTDILYVYIDPRIRFI